MADWRSDPRWRLLHYDADVFTEGPPKQPTDRAERSTDHCWASVYVGQEIVASWVLEGPSKREVADMRKRADMRLGRQQDRRGGSRPERPIAERQG